MAGKQQSILEGLARMSQAGANSRTQGSPPPAPATGPAHWQASDGALLGISSTMEDDAYGEDASESQLYVAFDQRTANELIRALRPDQIRQKKEGEKDVFEYDKDVLTHDGHSGRFSLRGEFKVDHIRRAVANLHSDLFEVPLDELRQRVLVRTAGRADGYVVRFIDDDGVDIRRSIIADEGAIVPLKLGRAADPDRFARDVDTSMRRDYNKYQRELINRGAESKYVLAGHSFRIVGFCTAQLSPDAVRDVEYMTHFKVALEDSKVPELDGDGQPVIGPGGGIVFKKKYLQRVTFPREGAKRGFVGGADLDGSSLILYGREDPQPGRPMLEGILFQSKIVSVNGVVQGATVFHPFWLPRKIEMLMTAKAPRPNKKGHVPRHLQFLSEYNAHVHGRPPPPPPAAAGAEAAAAGASGAPPKPKKQKLITAPAKSAPAAPASAPAPPPATGTAAAAAAAVTAAAAVAAAGAPPPARAPGSAFSFPPAPAAAARPAAREAPPPPPTWAPGAPIQPNWANLTAPAAAPYQPAPLAATVIPYGASAPPAAGAPTPAEMDAFFLEMAKLRQQNAELRQQHAQHQAQQMQQPGLGSGSMRDGVNKLPGGSSSLRPGAAGLDDLSLPIPTPAAAPRPVTAPAAASPPAAAPKAAAGAAHAFDAFDDDEY
eukprot:tig00000523_g1827.t1